MNHIPPHSLDAEQALLGGLLNDPRAYADVADVLPAEAFYTEGHQAIWGAMQSLDAAGKPIDLLTVIEQLGQDADRSYIGELAVQATSAANATHYAQIIRDKWILRSVSQAGLDAHKKVLSGVDPVEAVAYAQSRILEIGESRTSGPVSIKQILPACVDRIDELFHSDNEITGLATGFTDLDRMTTGFQPGDLVVIAGRPAMGKSAIAMNIAERAALEGKPTLVFSLEMPKEQLVNRCLSSLGRIPLQRIRTGKLWDDDWPLLTEAMNRLAGASLSIDETPAITVADARARARRLSRHGRLGLIVVDYLQLMSGSGENRASEISEISRGLKALAKEMQCPVIALSQLNRDVEKRPNKRPVMSDLRDGGSIEQDADIIIFPYRDEYYREADERDPRHGIAELNIAKQRNGETGTVYLTFLGQYTRFENCEHRAKERYRSALNANVAALNQKAGGFDA